MKYLWVGFLLFLFSATVSAQQNDWANFGKYTEQNKSVKPGTVVFLGNSITEGWASSRPDFFKKNNFTGRGISGQTSSQMLIRFRKDVVELKPAAVVILAGTNDIAQNTGYISLENILGNIRSMVEIAKANGIRPVLCSVLPACEFGWRKEIKPATEVTTLNAMIKVYAQENNLPYVDYHSALKDEGDCLPKKYADDGVHPNAAAFEIMESLVLKTLQQPTTPRRPIRRTRTRSV